jgi:hypothetical protein
MPINDYRSTITIPRDACATIMDSIQRAIIDKGASRATRKAAFSALLVLIDAGLIVGDTINFAGKRSDRCHPSAVNPRQLLPG